MKKFTLMLLVFIATAALMSMQTIKLDSQQNELQKSIENGQLVYQGNCLSCHQANGSGVYGIAPPLRKTSYVLGDKTKLIQIVLNGFNEDVEIDGEYYSNPMPAFPRLSNREIADVLTYIRNNFENNASAVTLDEVKKERSKMKAED